MVFFRVFETKQFTLPHNNAGCGAESIKFAPFIIKLGLSCGGCAAIVNELPFSVDDPCFFKDRPQEIYLKLQSCEGKAFGQLGLDSAGHGRIQKGCNDAAMETPQSIIKIKGRCGAEGDFAIFQLGEMDFHGIDKGWGWQLPQMHFRQKLHATVVQGLFRRHNSDISLWCFVCHFGGTLKSLSYLKG